MKLNCPICSAVLNLDDNLAKKLVRCPKCEQSFVVPQIAPTVVAQKQNVKIEQPPDEYELSASATEKAHAAPSADPSTLKFCPGCGAPWKKGLIECAKCHFVPALGTRLKPKAKEKVDLKGYIQPLYYLIVAGVLGYGVYYVYDHWNSIRATINSYFAN